jgi:hypothetical protein
MKHAGEGGSSPAGAAPLSKASPIRNSAVFTSAWTTPRDDRPGCRGKHESGEGPGAVAPENAEREHADAEGRQHAPAVVLPR